jgi:hypothetical protein
VRGDADMQARHVSGKWEGRRYPFEIRPCWAVGRIEAWAGSFPGGPFLFFYFFLFSFSSFLNCFMELAKNASNHFKPLSEVF